MQKESKFSERVDGGGRTYFLDLREAGNGKDYLTLTQSYKNKEGSFQRDRIFVFEEDVVKFGEAFQRLIDTFQSR